jgi:hypothetical protein
MRHAADYLATLAKNAHEVVMRIALVQEHGLLRSRRKLELRPEYALLVGAGREVTKVVEAALTGGDDERVREQQGERVDFRGREFLRVMRMNTRRRAKSSRVRARELDRRSRAREAAARDQHVLDADRDGGCDELLAIRVKAVVREVESDIDEMRGHHRML